MPRLLSPDVTTAPLDHEDLPADEVVQGSPTAAVRTLDALPGCEVGLWEMTEGTARDTEVDEVFVVVSGRGTVTFEDGERARPRARDGRPAARRGAHRVDGHRDAPQDLGGLKGFPTMLVG